MLKGGKVENGRAAGRNKAMSSMEKIDSTNGVFTFVCSTLYPPFLELLWLVKKPLNHIPKGLTMRNALMADTLSQGFKPNSW